MDAASIPETIRTIIAQAGDLGLRGAFTHIGAQKFRYRCATAEGEYRSGFRSRLTSEGGPPRVEFDVGLQARVNGKPGRAWTLIIVYEPDDTYTVWLVDGHARRNAESMVLACVLDVYCDTLQSVIEEAYDRAIAEHNGGFVAFHFLTGKDKDAIAKELAAAFKLTEPQAAKIDRRITGRVRLYSRVFELVPSKK